MHGIEAIRGEIRHLRALADDLEDGLSAVGELPPRAAREALGLLADAQEAVAAAAEVLGREVDVVNVA